MPYIVGFALIYQNFHFTLLTFQTNCAIIKFKYIQGSGEKMWCKNCEHETNNEYCELCNSKTEPVIPTEVFWCKHCKAPIIVAANEKQNCSCPICMGKIEYLASDLLDHSQ